MGRSQDSGTAYTLRTFVSEERLAQFLGGLASDDWHGVAGGSPELPGEVLIRLGTTEDGRLVCTGLLVGGWEKAEVSSTALRHIPIAALVTWVKSASQSDDPLMAGIFGSAVELAHTGAQRPRVRPGPRGHPRSHFEEVAAAYRAAIGRGVRSPVAALKRELNASEPTVRRWLQRCRDMGLLEPAPPGKAGEVPRKEVTE